MLLVRLLVGGGWWRRVVVVIDGRCRSGLLHSSSKVQGVTRSGVWVSRGAGLWAALLGALGPWGPGVLVFGLVLSLSCLVREVCVCACVRMYVCERMGCVKCGCSPGSPVFLAQTTGIASPQRVQASMPSHAVRHRSVLPHPPQQPGPLHRYPGCKSKRLGSSGKAGMLVGGQAGGSAMERYQRHSGQGAGV